MIVTSRCPWSPWLLPTAIHHCLHRRWPIPLSFVWPLCHDNWVLRPEPLWTGPSVASAVSCFSERGPDDPGRAANGANGCVAAGERQESRGKASRKKYPKLQNSFKIYPKPDEKWIFSKKKDGKWIYLFLGPAANKNTWGSGEGQYHDAGCQKKESGRKNRDK